MKKIFLFILPFLLCGCYDAKEPNNIAYVVAVGVDLTDEESIYEYTIQFAKTTQISGGSGEEGGKEGSDIVEVINVKAPSVYTAVNIANQVVSKNFTLAHTKLIVISEQLAKNGVRDLFDTFGRNSDIRPNIYVAVSNGNAKEYLESVKPIAEINPVTYYRLIFESERGGYVPRVLLKDFYFGMDDKHNQNVLPLAGVNEKNLENSSSLNSDEGHKNNIPDSDVNLHKFDFLTKRYYAGKIDVEKKNASEVIGMAVFDGDKMIAKADNIDSLIYNILRGTYKMSYVSFYNEASPSVPLTVSLKQRRMPKISVNTKKGYPKINITIYAEGQLISESTVFPSEADLQKTEDEISEEIREETEYFLKKTRDEFKADIVGFGQYARSNFLTNNEYELYNWREKYKNAEFDVKINFHIKNTGFIDLKDIERREKE